MLFCLAFQGDVFSTGRQLYSTDPEGPFGLEILEGFLLQTTEG